MKPRAKAFEAQLFPINRFVSSSLNPRPFGECIGATTPTPVLLNATARPVDANSKANESIKTDSEA
jgi:hypothetical protein